MKTKKPKKIKKTKTVRRQKMTKEVDDYFAEEQKEEQKSESPKEKQVPKKKLGQPLNPGPKRDDDQVLPDTFFNLLDSYTLPKKEE